MQTNKLKQLIIGLAVLGIGWGTSLPLTGQAVVTEVTDSAQSVKQAESQSIVPHSKLDAITQSKATALTLTPKIDGEVTTKSSQLSGTGTQAGDKITVKVDSTSKTTTVDSSKKMALGSE